MIEIDHVSFQYSGAEKENLQDFTLQISKGECVVLTGESGCGKTCVTRLINTLIPHFYEGELKGKSALMEWIPPQSNPMIYPIKSAPFFKILEASF